MKYICKYFFLLHELKSMDWQGIGQPCRIGFFHVNFSSTLCVSAQKLNSFYEIDIVIGYQLSLLSNVDRDQLGH